MIIEDLKEAVRRLGIVEVSKQIGVKEVEIAELLLRDRYRGDFREFSGSELSIVNKLGERVGLSLNNGQKKILGAIERQKKKGLPVRIALLKARQFGGSTLFEGMLSRENFLREGRSSIIIAHDLDSARNLRQMSQRFYDWYKLSKPTLKKETDKWWKFKTSGLDNDLRIDTAEELSAGHSLTIHNLHLSEIQLWRNAQELVKGLFPTVPNSSDTMIFMEGTGSGVGDYWYDFCQMAQQKGSGWEFVFVGWNEIEDYRLEFVDGREDFERVMDDEERELLGLGISLEQLHWRRNQIKNVYKGDVDAFRQQYPRTADECFLTSGRPVFSVVKCRENLGRCKSGKVGSLVGGESVVFVEEERGLWEVWEEVENVENLYVIAADAAEGIAVIPELGNRGGDYSAGKVYRRDVSSMVGRFHGRVDTDVFAEELRKGAKYWGCKVFPEQNGQAGGSLIAKMKELRVPMIMTPNLSKRGSDVKDEYGFETTKNTKRILIDELAERIREGSFVDYDDRFWKECSTYVYDEKGRMAAQRMKFDDLVIAGALCFQADKMLPMVFREKEKKKEVKSRDMDIPYNYEKEFTQKKVFNEMYAEF